MHVQVKYGLYDGDKFLEEIQDKMRVRDQFPKDVPFTVMSERILEEKYEPMYTNVYYKGALIAMCLDLQLLKSSDGKYDLQNLMRDLANKYGPEKSFEDDKLFDEIVAMTYPEVGDFLRTYVAGEEELPLQEYLKWAGIDYEPERQVETFSLGQIGLNVNEDREIFVTTTASMNDFGKAMGYEEGDVLKSINGEEISLATIERVLGSYGEGMEEGDKVKVEVYREVKGKRKRLKLKAKSVKTTRTERHFLKFNENPSEDQQYLRDSWLNAN